MGPRYNIQELLAGCKKKQPKYQKALVEQYSGLLFAICNRYLKDSGYAKDALQESLMRIFQNLDKYDFQKGSFESWISTITIRQCLTKLNKKKLALVDIEKANSYNNEFITDTSFLDDYDAEVLLQLIAELPDGHRAVFNLSAIDGYSHKEIAEFLGINVLASRTRLNRAKKILREKVNTLKKTESWVNTI